MPTDPPRNPHTRVRDHRHRDLPAEDRSLEAHDADFVVSQARRGARQVAELVLPDRGLGAPGRGGTPVKVRPRSSAGALAKVLGAVTLVGAAILLTGTTCPAGRDRPGDSGLSGFRSDTTVVGRVVENQRACEIDAACFLRIRFADTTVVAFYGAGERPTAPCEIPIETSNAAFGVEVGDRVEVMVVPCGDDAAALGGLTPVGPSGP